MGSSKFRIIIINEFFTAYKLGISQVTHLVCKRNYVDVAGVLTIINKQRSLGIKIILQYRYFQMNDIQCSNLEIEYHR